MEKSSRFYGKVINVFSLIRYTVIDSLVILINIPIYLTLSTTVNVYERNCILAILAFGILQHFSINMYDYYISMKNAKGYDFPKQRLENQLANMSLFNSTVLMIMLVLFILRFK